MGKIVEKTGHKKKPHTTCNHANFAPEEKQLHDRGVPDNTGKNTFLMLSCAAPLT